MAEIKTPIWDLFKDKQLEIFGLPDQFVHNYCKLAYEIPGAAYLTFKVSGVLPSLEAVAGKGYKVFISDKYLVIQEHVEETTKSEKPEMFIQGLTEHMKV